MYLYSTIVIAAECLWPLVHLFSNSTFDLHVQLPAAVYVTVFVSALRCGIHRNKDHLQSSCTLIALVSSRGSQSTSGEHQQQTSFPLSVQYWDCRNSTLFMPVSVGLCFPTILEKRWLLYFPTHSIKFPTKKSLKSRWEWRSLQEYYKIQLFSFLSPASGKTVFSSTWKCVDSSDIYWPFHRFVWHTPSVYWGVLQRLTLRLFFFHRRNLSLLADSCSTCKLLFYLSMQLHLTLHWSFLVCHRFSVSVFLSLKSGRFSCQFGQIVLHTHIFLVSLGHKVLVTKKSSIKALCSTPSTLCGRFPAVEFVTAVWPVMVSALNILSCLWCTWIVEEFC